MHENLEQFAAFWAAICGGKKECSSSDTTPERQTAAQRVHYRPLLHPAMTYQLRYLMVLLSRVYRADGAGARVRSRDAIGATRQNATDKETPCLSRGDLPRQAANAKMIR